MIRNRFFLLVLLAVIVGCPDDGTSDANFDPDACSEFVVPHELGLRWETLNHRVARWSVGLSSGECRADQVRATFVGGDYSTGETTTDTPHLRFSWEPVETAPERLDAARLSIEATVGPEGVVEGTETFERTELNLRNYPEVVALIEGVHFDTGVEQSDSYPDGYRPERGYTLEGFGASVSSTAVDDAVRVAYRIRFDPGASPDRPDLNRSLPHARVGATLDVLLLGVADAEVFRGEVAYRQEFPEPTPFEDQEIEVASEDLRRVVIQGEPSGSTGIYGLTEFDFDYDFDMSCTGDSDCPAADECGDDGVCAGAFGDAGEYIRAIRVGVERTDYAPQTGEGTFLLTGYTSTASEVIAFHALRYDFQAAMAWVQAGDAAERRQIEEPFETGEMTLELDAGSP